MRSGLSLSGVTPKRLRLERRIWSRRIAARSGFCALRASVSRHKRLACQGGLHANQAHAVPHRACSRPVRSLWCHQASDGALRSGSRASTLGSRYKPWCALRGGGSPAPPFLAKSITMLSGAGRAPPFDRGAGTALAVARVGHRLLVSGHLAPTPRPTPQPYCP
jgi:hypothetical protein